MTVSNTTLSTASGTFLSILPNLNSEDVLKTVLLAVIGAVVSFTLSFVFKILIAKYRR
ncbi:hypothetical protein [Flavobacterium limi]|nr:hypothetical protein [Flavobacterium limi]